METKEMTGQESLELIARMIRNTQDKLERHGGMPFLIWGYTTLAVSLAIWLIYRVSAHPMWMLLWFAIPVIGGGWTYLTSRNREKMVTTFIDRTINNIWVIIGSCCVAAAIFASFYVPTREHFPILFTEMFLLNIGVAITGLVIRLRYITVFGCFGIMAAFLLYYVEGMDQILGFALISLITLVIPGHIMNYQGRKQKIDGQHAPLIQS